jgi:hypothetical protein
MSARSAQSHSSARFPYPHVTILVASLVASVVLLRVFDFHPLVQQLSQFALPAAFLGGILFNYSLTFVWGTSILYLLGGSYSPGLIWLCATIGAVIGNLTILKFIQNDELHHELRHLFSRLAHHKATHLHRPIHPQILKSVARHHARLKIIYWHFLLSILGGLIIMSPLPDELGVALLGWANLSKTKFVLISFFLNGLGLAGIIWAGQLH